MAQVALEWFRKATDRLQTARCPICSPCPGPISTATKAAKAAGSANFEVYLNSKATRVLFAHLVLMLAFNLLQFYVFNKEARKGQENPQRKSKMRNMEGDVPEELEMARRTYNTMIASLTEGEKAAMNKVQEFEKQAAMDIDNELRKTVKKAGEHSEKIMISNIFFSLLISSIVFGPVVDSVVWGINSS